jgi:hypothetical protein
MIKLKLNSEGILAMAKSKTCGVLLPTTHYLLKLKVCINVKLRILLQEK